MRKFKEWLIERTVIVCGLIVACTVCLVFLFLALESRYAFNAEFPFGYRIVAESPGDDAGESVAFSPYASFVGAHPDGGEGLDEMELDVFAPTLEELSGVATAATCTLPESNLQANEARRDDWRRPSEIGSGHSIRLYVFATPEHAGKEMRVRWEPDAGFLPNDCPYDLRLRLARVPTGIELEPFEVDLKKQPSGSIRIPTWIAHSDSERVDGYVLEVQALRPKGTSQVSAVLGQLNSTHWSPTGAYARFGILPLLFGTATMTLIALGVAVPFGVLCAVFVSEFASKRLRHLLKSTVELLSSVPTVVIAYLGLMMLAPWLMSLVGSALRMESGRNLLTCGLVLGVLILPTVVTVAEDALGAVPRSLKEGGFALGLERSEVIRKVLLPAAKVGIVAAVLLGFSRAVGETMILWILSGGTATWPRLDNVSSAASSLVGPARGIPDTIAIEMANVDFEGVQYGYLFLIGVLLFALTMLLNVVGYSLIRRKAWRS